MKFFTLLVRARQYKAVVTKQQRKIVDTLFAIVIFCNAHIAHSAEHIVHIVRESAVSTYKTHKNKLITTQWNHLSTSRSSVALPYLLQYYRTQRCNIRIIVAESWSSQQQRKESVQCINCLLLITSFLQQHVQTGLTKSQLSPNTAQCI